MVMVRLPERIDMLELALDSKATPTRKSKLYGVGVETDLPNLFPDQEVQL